MLTRLSQAHQETTSDISTGMATLATILSAYATGAVTAKDDSLDLEIDPTTRTVRLYAVSVGSTEVDDFEIDRATENGEISARRIRVDHGNRKPFQVSFVYSLDTLEPSAHRNKTNRQST